jgi:UDP:flavonoid glycosyltransferase YjiC (YdhE family)
VRVLAACSLGGAGHLRPLLPLLAASRHRGHDVLVVAPPAMTSMVEEAGYPCHPGGEPPEADIAPIRERLPTAPRDEAIVLGNRELFGRLAAQAMMAAVERVCGHWRPDLVLRDPCEYASAAVAGALGIPVAQVAISLAAGEAASVDAAAPALERLWPGTTEAVRAAPYLTRLPASLDPSPFARTVRYREESSGGSRALPDWWGGSEGPLVYLTFGTVLGYLSIAGGVFRTAVEAMADLPVRVLLTTGHRLPHAELGPVPGNVHVETWVDQADVLGHAAVVVCHGGSGTVFGALARGVPVVALPVFADQFENGRRVSAAGAGLVVEAGAAGSTIGAADASRITDAVRAVLTDPAYRARARSLADESADAPPPGALVEALVSGTL